MSGQRLSDLNNHLFAQLDRLANTSMTPEQLAAEVSRADAIVSVSDQVIHSADLQLQAARLYAAHGQAVLPMLPLVGREPE